jgi:hypothetical protein
MTTLIVLFNLKPGLSAQDYEHWARTTDLVTVRSLKSIDQFQVFRTQGVLGSDQKAPYQYVELLTVNDMPGLFADISTPIMQRVAAEFQGFADAPIFMISHDIEGS